MHPTDVALTRVFDAQLSTLPETRRDVPRRTRLEVDVGATHALAGVSLLEGESVAPGRTALARITADRPLALRHGERLVLRGAPSLAGVGSTVGGLVVVRPIAERVRRRAVALERAQRSANGDARERARVELEASGAKGLSRADLVARASYKVSKSSASEGVVAVANDRYVSRSTLDSLARGVLQTLSDFHGKNPAERGIDRRALSTLGDDPVIDFVLGELVAQSKITRAGEVVARAGWKPRGLDDVPYVAQVRAMLARAGLASPRVAEMAEGCHATVKDVEHALKRLVELGHVVKVSPELFTDASAVKDLEARLIAWLEEKGTIDAQGFKDLTGLSRKYVIPYAEHFDVKKLTIRVGDVRKLRGR